MIKIFYKYIMFLSKVSLVVVVLDVYVFFIRVEIFLYIFIEV